MAATELVERLEQAHLDYELLAHRHTETASAEAKALGVPADEVAKTLVVRTGEGYARAVLPAGEFLDLRKVRTALDTERAVLATEAQLAADYDQFELGAVPPVGGRDEPVIVDPRLTEREWIVFEAGTHDESVRLRSADLVEVAGARVRDICRD